MTASELQHIINQGESETLEFKSKFNYDVIETLVAFANTSGGRVLIGVNNKKEITGVDTNEESVQNWINEIKGKTAPFLVSDAEIIPVNNKYDNQRFVTNKIRYYFTDRTSNGFCEKAYQ